jgi:hypothetical protein
VLLRSSALLVVTILGAAPPCAFGQQLQFGVIGGTNLTRDSHSTNDTFTISGADNPQYQLNVLTFSRSHSFIVGAAMELSLPRNFSVEVNALHRNLRSTQVVTSLFPNRARQSVTDQFLDAKTWEFPVLLKYALPVSHMKPFVEVGPSFRVWQEPQDVEPSNYGFTVGLGAEMNRGHFKFAPVVRYTHWAFDGRPPLRPTNSDQLELLGAFTYRTEADSRGLAGRKIWLGVVGGTIATDGFHLGMFAQPQIESRPYVAGLSVELALRERLSLEVDSLYRPFHATTLYPNPDGSIFKNPFTVLTWQFPVLGKYRLSASRLAPFVEVGPSLRLSGNTNGYNPSRYGAAVGTGVEAKAGIVRLGPAVRYTRWAKDQFALGAPRYDYTRTAANQLEILFGFSF